MQGCNYMMENTSQVQQGASEVSPPPACKTDIEMVLVIIYTYLHGMKLSLLR